MAQRSKSRCSVTLGCCCRYQSPINSIYRTRPRPEGRGRAQTPRPTASSSGHRDTDSLRPLAFDCPYHNRPSRGVAEARSGQTEPEVCNTEDEVWPVPAHTSLNSYLLVIWDSGSGGRVNGVRGPRSVDRGPRTLLTSDLVPPVLRSSVMYTSDLRTSGTPVLGTPWPPVPRTRGTVQGATLERTRRPSRHGRAGRPS